MSISKFIKRNLTSFQRSKQKKKIISAIYNTEQKEEDVVNIHRIDKNNVGDFFCAPHLYFDQLKGKTLDIFDFKSTDKTVTDNFINTVSNNSLIIGGGGLLNRSSFAQQLKLFENLAAKGKKTVLWGVGHNEKNKHRFGKVNSYNINPDKFGLVGIRDYSSKNAWVPCASCLHPIFDKPYTETQEFGIIYHKKTIKDKALLKKLDHYPSTSNTTDLEDMISIISKSETIVTDSYHAMYWAMLLEKKVIVIPNSSKFYDFKYQPVFSSFQNFDTQIKKTKSYTGLLEECREINLKFAEKVFNYLNI